MYQLQGNPKVDGWRRLKDNFYSSRRATDKHQVATNKLRSVAFTIVGNPKGMVFKKMEAKHVEYKVQTKRALNILRKASYYWTNNLRGILLHQFKVNMIAAKERAKDDEITKLRKMLDDMANASDSEREAMLMRQLAEATAKLEDLRKQLEEPGPKSKAEVADQGNNQKDAVVAAAAKTHMQSPLPASNATTVSPLCTSA